MLDYEPSAELIAQGAKEYTLSRAERDTLRERLEANAARVEFLQGPDAPRTPSGRVPAKVQRELDELRREQTGLVAQLQDAPPAPESFERVLVELTGELDKLVKVSEAARDRFAAQFQIDPTHTIRYYGSDVVIAHVQARLAQRLLDYAGECIERDGHTVETLEAIRDAIARERDQVLRATLNKVEGGMQYWTLPSEQIGRVRFVEHLAWPLRKSQRWIDAYREYLVATPAQ